MTDLPTTQQTADVASASTVRVVLAYIALIVAAITSAAVVGLGGYLFGRIDACQTELVIIRERVTRVETRLEKSP